MNYTNSVSVFSWQAHIKFEQQRKRRVQINVIVNNQNLIFGMY